MLEHILKGSTNIVVYLYKRRIILPETTEREQHYGN